ncbi:hypothetical protein ACFQMA_14265 [Halosimplex aquaticum]|uniref:Uncharacterized protein n=1 Tax=Halosimplex aquaticum TaxID=3026162 RepID=A0ABD5Y0R7_9EURY|nr:hypothetical protein [Halosimplex aquaticum]
MESGSESTEATSDEEGTSQGDDKPDAILETDAVELAELRCGVSLGEPSEE